MKPLGLAGRLRTAEGLLAAACAASLLSLFWSVQRRESSLAETLLVTRGAGQAQDAALSCRRYLSLALASREPSRLRDAGREAARRLGKTRVLASKAGSKQQSEDLDRLARFLGASRALLDRIGRLERQGRSREAAALYDTGLRPLNERHLASALERSLEEEKASREDSLRRSRLWLRLSFLATAAFGALASLLFALWTRRFAGYLLRTIERIRRAMAAVASGNFAVAVEAEREDEMGVLAGALNLMARRLEQGLARRAQTERSAAYARLAATVSRALETPLSAVIRSLSLALDEARLDPRGRERLQTALAQARRCGEVVRSLLQFTERGRPAREAIRISDVVGRAVESLAPTLALRSIALTFDRDGGLPEVSADAGGLEHVLFNLIVNASQAIPEGRPGRVAVSARTEGPWLCVAVQDDGEGIPEENRDFIFEPFFTTRGPGAGPGLGLSSARKIARDHGGDILFQSRPGRGSVFELRLPPGEGGGRAAEPAGKPAGRILVVDDERPVLALAERLLKREGYEVVAPPSALDALRALEKGDFALVLCDYRMPELSGIQFYEAARRRRPELAGRFVFTTGEIAAKEFQAFAASNGIPILLKPFDIEELARVVRERIGELKTEMI